MKMPIQIQVYKNTKDTDVYYDREADPDVAATF